MKKVKFDSFSQPSINTLIHKFILKDPPAYKEESTIV